MPNFLKCQYSNIDILKSLDNNLSKFDSLYMDLRPTRNYFV